MSLSPLSIGRNSSRMGPLPSPLSLLRPSAPAPSAAALPSPPTDEEKYWYFGRQHRWLLWLQSLSFALIGVSVLRFSLSDTRLLLFLVPFSLFAVGLVISLASSTRGRRVDRVDHELRVLEYAPDQWPTVDVFLPSAGEPLEVLANTYRYVAELQWPSPVTVWVLDDAARGEVRALADRHGFAYRSRPDRGRLKKAGNLRFGLEQSGSDLIVVLDADFVPRPDFLHELVPYFAEPDVGIVQSPQFFDATRGMPWLQRCAGATQELFYRWVQPARDRSGAAICVGTCAIYRRRALEAAGGFAQIGHSEDVHTGVNLMKAGYGLRYVPILVSKGLCPDAVLSFLNQQYRWCTGSMSLLADSGFHEAAHIGTRQRLCFWAGFLYYIATAVNVFTMALPALAMLWLLPQFVLPRNSAYLLGALVLWTVVLPRLFKGRWRLDVLRVQTLYSFAHAVAIVHVLSGRTKEWVATGASVRASSTPVGVTVLRVAKTWVALTQLGIWAGLARGVAEFGIDRFWAMIAFAVLASYVQLPLLFLRAGEPAPDRAPLPVRLRAGAGWAASGLRDALGRGGRIVQLPGTRGYRPPRLPAPAAPGLRSWRPDIQGLRAVAVTLVVLYHAHVPLVRGGYIGVDVFFVISGFLITGGLLRQAERDGRISLTAFYAGRVKRLAIPAALVLVVTLLAVRVWDSLFQVREVTADGVFAALYAMNYRLAAQGVNYQVAEGRESPLQHYWSLAVEEQFYVFWPVVVVLCLWAARRHHRVAVALAVTVLSGASLWACLTLTETNQPLAYFSLHTRAWELGAGAALALAAPHLVRLPAVVARAASWLGLVGIMWAGLRYTELTVFPGTAALLPVAATALVIAAGCRPTSGSAEVLLDRRPMQAIGKVSYAWYLWHWPLLVLVPMMLGYELSWKVEVEVVVLALWLAVLTHHLLEAPALRSRLRRPVWLAAGPGLAGATAAVAVLVAASVPSLVGGGGIAVAVAATDTAAIARGVEIGTLTVAAPSNLTPALSDIRADQPESTLNGCHAGFLVVQQGECVYGDPQGERTMVLMGDSHAQQWLPALDAQARELGWRLVSWTKAACPVAALTVVNEALGNRPYSECDEWRRIALAKVEGLRPDVVVVGQSDSVPGRQFSNTDWADATAETLTGIRAAGTPVVFVRDTPLPLANVPQCVADNLAKVDPCTFMREDGYAFAPGRHQAVADTLESVGIATVDPVDWVCTPRKCPPVVGGMLVWRDGSHLSTPYSAYLAPATAGLFVPAPAPS